MFGSRLVLLGACLTAIDVLSGVDARACDDVEVTISNSTDIDFYKTCPVIDSVLFFIDHSFVGPFNLPGVESIPKLSSGYYGPKLEGSDSVDDGVTTVSMPDLVNLTSGGMLFGYIDNLTSVSFPKLATIAGDIAIVGDYELRNLSLPALSTVAGAVLLDGHFDQIDFPSLKSVSWMRIESTGNISCPALGAAFASLTFTGDDTDPYQGFTCWTGDADNSWNSSDPINNPTTGGSTGSGSNSTSDTNYKMTSNSRVWGADLFLLVKWDAFSTLSHDEQLTQLFSLYIQLPFSQRYAYKQRGIDRGLNKAADLAQADQELLSRLRTPEERQIVDMVWVRTCYDAGTDSAFEAFMRAISCETELPIFQDSTRYNFGGGDGWRRIFSRLPQILEPYNRSPDEYEARKQKALEECIEAERQDTQDVEDQGGDPEEDGTYWPELYSAYHYRAKVGMVLVVDRETLCVAAEDPKQATVLAVWFDEMSRVIRQTRMTAQETWNVEGLELTMGGALQEHGEWTRADIGEDYDWEGPFGPPFATK